MNVSNFLDTGMEKGVHDIVFVSKNGLIINGKHINYEKSEVMSVKYQKVAIIEVNETIFNESQIEK